MKINYFIFLPLFVHLSYAQDSSTFVIKADQLASDFITPEKIYKYPKFTRGKIIFRDKTATEAPINYNYLISEVEFIGPQKDTLAIASHQLPTIQRILVNKDTFYYQDGYLQQVLQTPLGILAKRQSLIIVKVDKLGAYDMPANTTKTESPIVFRDYFGSTINPDLRVRENITMTYRTEYFIGDKYLYFLPANKKSFLKIYPSRKHTINTYLKENTVDFKNLNDLTKMMVLISAEEN